MDIKIKLHNSNNEKTVVKKDIENDNKFKDNLDTIQDEYKNKQLELIWKKFLDENPFISKKINEVPENASTAGSLLIGNGMYEEAKKWKEYRKTELSKINKGDEMLD